MKMVVGSLEVMIVTVVVAGFLLMLNSGNGHRSEIFGTGGICVDFDMLVMKIVFRFLMIINVVKRGSCGDSEIDVVLLLFFFLSW